MSTTSESYLVGLIGDGITRSLTPPMHETEARNHGLHYLYRPVDLEVIGRPGEDVGELLRAGRDLGFNAFNITHPCKQLVLDHLDEVAPEAAALRAVNTVVIRDGRFVGHNTDVSGFAAGFRAVLPGAAKDRVVQVGTGGAGSAVASALPPWGDAEAPLDLRGEQLLPAQVLLQVPGAQRGGLVVQAGRDAGLLSVSEQANPPCPIASYYWSAVTAARTRARIPSGMLT